MKAIYNSPTIEYASYDVLQLMAGSLGSDGPNNFDPTTVPETDATSGNLSRRRNVWDEEDFENEVEF